MKTKRGIATLEILIAFAVIALSLTGVALVAFGGQTAGLDVNLTNHGLYRAASHFESNVAAAIASWSTLTGESTTEDGGFYNIARNVSLVSPCIKQVDVKVSWTSEKNRSLYASSTTLFGSVAEAKALGGGCSPFPPSDWDNPDSYGSIDVGGSAGTGVAIRSISGTRYAFLTSNPSAAGQEDFYVFDVSDLQNPSETAKINTGQGLNDIAIGGSYAFVVQDDDENQLQVIDISDPENPDILTEVTLEDVDGAYPEGRVIAYYDEKIYIGTWNNNVPADSPEFLVYDVSTPASPSFLGSLNLGHSINDMATDGSYVYLATTDDTGEMTVVDVTNPALPSVAGVYDAPWSAKDGESIAAKDSTAYLGREKASFGDYDFLTIDVSTPSTPMLLGKYRLVMNGAGAVLSGIAVQGNYAFVGTTDTNDEFRVLNVSDLENPAPHGCPPYNYSAKVTDLVYADNYIFAANESNDALRIIYDDPNFTCH